MCKTEESAIPLFLQYWWMDTVCDGKQWDVALAYSPDGEIVAALPYLEGSRWGMKYVLQPQLTQYNGPWYRQDADIEQASQQLSTALHQHNFLFFAQNFSPSVNGLPCWKGFEYTERRTYRIEDISNTQAVFDGFDKQRRQRPIHRAAKVLSPVDDLTPEAFARFHVKYWESRGQKDTLSEAFISRTIHSALSRSQGILLGVRDEAGRLHAARFVAYDKQCAYSLLSALNPQGHHNGASPLLFWMIIQRLCTRTKAFDFEGSMDAGIAFSYSLYGAHPVTYPRVVHYRHPLIRHLLKKKVEN